MDVSAKTANVWKRILRELQEDRRRIIFLFLCLFISSVITFVQPLIIRIITDKGMMQKDFRCILYFSFILFGILLVGQLVGIVQVCIFSDISNSVNYRLYQKAFYKLVHLPVSYFQEKSSTEIMGALNRDIDMISTMLNQYTSFSISSILQMMTGIGGLFFLNGRMAIFMMLLIPAKYLFVKILSNKKSELIEKLINSENAFLGWMGEQIDGIEEVKLWNLYEKLHPLMGHKRKVIMELYKKNTVLDQFSLFYDTIIDIVVTVLLYIYSGYLIVKGEFSIGSAFAFISYSVYITNPISSVVKLRYYLAQVKPSAKRLFSFFDLEEEFLDKKEEKSNSKIDFALEFLHVEFFYRAGEPVFSDVNFSIKKGEKVAIIGENGVGKSTIFQLAMGFYMPQKGEIKIMGDSTSSIEMEALRKQIAVVRQDPYLFSESIAENIRLFYPYTRKEVIDATRRSGAEAFINALPNGFDERIGQDGAKLSGGEKEKIAVARALLKDSQILFFDEATAGYDKKSEENFYKLFSKELKDKTVILITHRETNLKYMDRILELKQGKVVEKLENIKF